MTEYISWPAGFSIDPRKVTNYLLDPDSRDGRAKAALLLRRGFRRDEPHSLMRALFRHTGLENFKGIKVAARGHKLVFEGPLSCVDGSTVMARSVWQVDASGNGVARFLTAYPI